MADAALTQVESASAGCVRTVGQGAGPGDVVRIDVDDCGARIDCRAAPLRAAIETGKHKVFGAKGQGKKRTAVAKFLEIFECPGVRFGRALGEHVFREALAREGNGAGRQRLFFGSDFAGNVAGWVGVRLKRKKWLS